MTVGPKRGWIAEGGWQFDFGQRKGIEDDVWGKRAVLIVDQAVRAG